MTLRGTLVAPLIAALSFLAIAALAARALGVALGDRLEPFAKVRMAASDPQADTVFIGTSHVEYGIIPKVFDEKMSALGIATRSYNIAAPGLSMLESTEHIHRLFEEKPCCIKYVFLEPDFASLLIVRQPDTLRAINFFDVTNAYRAARFLEFPTTASPLELTRLQYLSNILRSVARHYSNIGMVYSEPDMYTNPNISGRGYPIDNPHVKQTYSPTGDEFAAYEAMLAHISDAPVRPWLLSEYHAEILLSLADYIASKQARLILLVPPQSAFIAYEIALLARVRESCIGAERIIMDFSNPALYPALFDPINRMDDDHMNLVGATMLTGLVADRLAEQSISAMRCRRRS